MDLFLGKCMKWSYVHLKFYASMQKYDHTFNHMISDRHLRTHWKRKKERKKACYVWRKLGFYQKQHKGLFTPKVKWKSKANCFRYICIQYWPTHQRKIALLWCRMNWFDMNRSKRYALFLFKIFFALNIHWNICVWYELPLTLTFSLYGMQTRRNLNSHRSGCFMRESYAITIEKNITSVIFWVEICLKQDSDLWGEGW